MFYSVPNDLRPLLESVVAAAGHAPLIWVTTRQVFLASEDERQRIFEMLSTELCETGITDGEVNGRGIRLERLMDCFPPSA